MAAPPTDRWMMAHYDPYDTYTLGTTTSTVGAQPWNGVTYATGVKTRCNFYGHEVDDIGEYPDGIIAGECRNCKDRVTFHRIAGGPPVLRIKQLLEVLMASKKPAEAVMMA